MGVKWNSFPVLYYVNSANSGLDPIALNAEFKKAFDTWDGGSRPVSSSFGGSAVPAVGDGKNEVYFARDQ